LTIATAVRNEQISRMEMQQCIEALEIELGTLKRERDALAVQCDLLQGIDREKVALEEHCQSLKGEVELTIATAVRNEQISRMEMQQRILALSQKIFDHEESRLDEKSQRIHAQALLADFETEFADEIYQKTREIESLQQEILLLNSSNSKINELNVEMSRLCKLSDEKIAFLTIANNASQSENQAIKDSLNALRLSLDTSHKHHEVFDQLDSRNSRLAAEFRTLSDAFSQLQNDNAALFAKFQALSSDRVFISNQNQEDLGSPLNLQRNLSLLEISRSEVQPDTNMVPASSRTSSHSVLESAVSSTAYQLFIGLLQNLALVHLSLNVFRQFLFFARLVFFSISYSAARSPGEIRDVQNGLTIAHPAERMRLTIEDFKRRHPVRNFSHESL
jgi:hypothetical protein